MEHRLFNLKLLYVEDDDETRNEMGKFLKRRFSRVILAENGREGLEKFMQFKPDLVVADLLMDGMDGIEMVEQIRVSGSDCPVLITSALEDVRSILKTVDQGIVKYIIKPVDTEEFHETLMTVAGRLYSQKSPFLKFDVDKKRELEKDIRASFAAFLKKKSGKGPKNTDVFLTEDGVELTAEGVLSLFEETLISVPGNEVIVEQNRKLFQSVIRSELEHMLGELLDCQLRMEHTSFDLPDRKEKYTFRQRM